MSKLMCQRKGCTEPATVPLQLDLGIGIPFKTFVCEKHAQELRAELRAITEKWRKRVRKTEKC